MKEDDLVFDALPIEMIIDKRMRASKIGFKGGSELADLEAFSSEPFFINSGMRESRIDAPATERRNIDLPRVYENM